MEVLISSLRKHKALSFGENGYFKREELKDHRFLTGMNEDSKDCLYQGGFNFE